jgi:hypothetical protein
MQPVDQQELQEQQQRDQRHSQNQQQAGDLAREQMRDMMRNPEVIRELSDADEPAGAQTDKSWVPEITEEHLHRDQVYAIHGDRELWERKFLNQNTADLTIMSYPRPESKTPHERVRRVRNRIRGDSKKPLSPDERRKLRQTLGEQKYDRETRASDGKFMELMLSQVVESRQKTSGNDDDSFWGQFLG